MEEDEKGTNKLNSGGDMPPAVIFPSRFVGEGTAKPDDARASGVPGQAPEVSDADDDDEDGLRC